MSDPIQDISGAVERVSAFAKTFFPPELEDPLTASRLARLRDLMWADIAWAYGGDKAATSPEEVDLYPGVYAIGMYRLSNMLLRELHEPMLARYISIEALNEVRIDIHPGAAISSPFAIDHGSSIVIGESVEIGPDCLMLNDVTLGAARIRTRDIDWKRHPTIGARVTISNHVTVLGPVRVGNDCHIGPGVLIEQDIPDDSTVRIITRYQIVTTRPARGDRAPSARRIRPDLLRMISPESASIELEVEVDHVSADTRFALKQATRVVECELLGVRVGYADLRVDIRWCEPGNWDLVVTNIDGQTCELPSCLTLE
jgi:serine O-acetyltransferase